MFCDYYYLLKGAALAVSDRIEDQISLAIIDVTESMAHAHFGTGVRVSRASVAAAANAAG